MHEEAVRKFQKELNSGAISLVLLQLIQDSHAPMYGYEIAKCLQAKSKIELPMNQAALYPVLRSLEKQGLLSSKQVPSDSGPPRKYYQLTAAGRRVLPLWRQAWDNIKMFVDAFQETADERSTSNARPRVSEKPGTSTETPLRGSRRGSPE